MTLTNKEITCLIDLIDRTKYKPFSSKKRIEILQLRLKMEKYLNIETDGDFSNTDLTNLKIGDKVKVIRVFANHKRIQVGDFFTVKGYAYSGYNRSDYSYKIKHDKTGFITDMNKNNKYKIYGTL